MPTVTKFKDFSLSFTRNKITNDLLVKKENAAIKQAVINILLTEKGERLYDSNFGSDVRSYLFEPLDYATAGLVQTAVEDCLVEYEPRINILQLSVMPDFDQNGFEVNLAFSIKGRDDLPPQDIEFFLNRTR